MRINDLFRGFLSPPANGSAAAPVSGDTSNKPASTPAEKPIPPSLASQPASQQFRDILAEYDVQQITPREYSALLQRLYAAGQITDRDFQQLAELRANLDAAQFDPDEPLDLLSFLQERITAQEGAANATVLPASGAKAPDQSGLAVSLNQLEWLQKFSLVHDGADAEAFDALV